MSGDGSWSSNGLNSFVSRRYIMVAGDDESKSISRRHMTHPGEQSEKAALTARGVDERVKVLFAARAGAEMMP